MSLKSSTSPHLTALTEILETYSQNTGKPAKAHANVSAGELTELALTHENGEYINEPALIQEFMTAVTDLVNSQTLPEECEIRLETVPVKEAEEPAEEEEPEETDFTQEAGDPGDLSAAPHAQNNGLLLRKTLLGFGHSTGYKDRDIDFLDEKLGGKILPEIRFFRATVREGKVAEGPRGEIESSPIDADFGASAFAKAKVKLPAPTPDDVVQPRLSHPLWVELAHDESTLYAADLAPGASGEVGQIIARSSTDAKAPHLVARSLAQFVSSDWVEEPVVDEPVETSLPEEKVEPQVRWQAISSVLKPSRETRPMIVTATFDPSGIGYLKGNDTDEGIVEEFEQSSDYFLEDGFEKETMERPEKVQGEEESGTVASETDNSEEESVYRSQIKTLLGRDEDAEKSAAPTDPPIDLAEPITEPVQIASTKEKFAENFAAEAFEDDPTEEEFEEVNNRPQMPVYPESASDRDKRIRRRGLRRFFLG